MSLTDDELRHHVAEIKSDPRSYMARSCPLCVEAERCGLWDDTPATPPSFPCPKDPPWPDGCGGGCSICGGTGEITPTQVLRLVERIRALEALLALNLEDA